MRKEESDGISWSELASSRQWLICGTVCAFLAFWSALDLDVIVENFSWRIVGFFIIYTFILLTIFWYYGKRSCGHVASSWRPNGLARFRNYLTFLPITHIIQHGDVLTKDSETGNNEKLNENELSIRICLQKELLIQGILDEYIAPWYTKISSNTAFLTHSRNILQIVFQQFDEKLRQVDKNNLAKEAIQTVHMHWKEYCDASLKSSSTGESVIKCFKFVHPYLQDSVEVSQRCEKMICDLLESFVIPEMQSTLLCQFLSGILVKSFFIYYLELISQPSWINNNLISILSSGSILAELAGSSSQNSSAPATPLPEKSPKNAGDTTCSPMPTPSDSTTSEHTPPSKPPPSNCITPHRDDDDDNDSDIQRFFFGKEIHPTCAQVINDKLPQYVEKINGSPYRTSRSQGTPSPSPSVSSALSGVIPTSTLPLLPSCSYLLDQTFASSSVIDENYSFEAVTTISDDFRTQNYYTKSNTSYNLTSPEEDDVSSSSEITSSDIIASRYCLDNSEEVKNDNCEKSVFKSSTPTAHYYSFEEVSPRKSSHPLLETGTLSVDGAIDGLKKQYEKEKSNSHQLKIVTELEMKQHGRSPVYEEPEDFATSIAKLRSLLEQRESKKNLKIENNTHVEADRSLGHGPESCETSTNEYMTGLDTVAGGANETRNEQLESDHGSLYNLEGDDIEQVPELKCYFHNITIPKVESFSDSGGQFDFYCIQYEGVYFDEKYDEDFPKVILRNTTVKRRFKEFLLLQSKLEERSEWKLHLKGIKAPNRWLNLSFSKTDAATTKKAMLERYLNQLCTHSVLGTSREVLQFMAYGDEGFALGPMDINDPKHLLSNRLDKLAKKFTGVLNSLKDAFPSFESNPPSPQSDSDISGCFPPLSDSIPSFQFTQGLSLNEMENSKEGVSENHLDHKWFENLVPNLTRSEGSDNDRIQSDMSATRTASEFTNNVDLFAVEDETASTYPLAAALTQFLCDVLWLSNCRPHNASVSTFMSISGKSLENYVQETIDVFVSDEAVLGYLEWLARSLKSDVEPINDNFPQCENTTELDLKNCLRRRIPAWVRWMWGRNRLDLTIDRITGFFQNPVINQDLVLSLSELLFSKIIQSN